MNIEPLVSGTALADQDLNTASLADHVLRPGIDRLQFLGVIESWEATPGWSMTLEWTDRYYLHGELKEQALKRTLRRPDIVLSAADLGTMNNSVLPKLISRSIPNWKRVGVDLSTGPGILQGSVTITLAKLRPALVNHFPGHTSEASAEPLRLRWGSFGSESEIVVYPSPSTLEPPRLLIQDAVEGSTFISLEQASYEATRFRARFRVEFSTDLRNWVSTGITLESTNSFRAAVPLSQGVSFFRAVRLF